MSVSKKYVVQKSFRIDAKLESDLEYLSQKLNRPQNELVNFALEQFMWDNRDWFIENLLVDYCDTYFEFNQEYAHCEIGGVIIDLKTNKDCSTTMYFCYKDKDGNIIDENTNIYQDSVELVDDLKHQLRQIALIYLSPHADSIQDILKNRLNYK